MKLKIFTVAILFLFGIVLVGCGGGNTKKTSQEVMKVTKGNILASIPASGSVTPRNRLELKPPVAGRIDSILVNEGDRVKKGQILAWLSSAERAALLDAARAKGTTELKYWQDVYKPAPLIAPIDGFIILRSMEPGQTVSVSDPILVMADKLIVKANVDETDLSRVKVGERTTIVLDAYPDKSIDGVVEHIKYESQVINNVTVYEVDVIAKEVPSYFRSGQSATANFQEENKQGVLLIPTKAIKKSNGQSYVFIKGKSGNLRPVKIQVGVESGDQSEITSGVSEEQEVTIPDSKTAQDLLSNPRGGGPFGGMFGGNRRR